MNGIRCKECGNDVRNHKVGCAARFKKPAAAEYITPFFVPIGVLADGRVVRMLRLDLRPGCVDRTRADLEAMLPLALSGTGKCGRVTI